MVPNLGNPISGQCYDSWQYFPAMNAVTWERTGSQLIREVQRKVGAGVDGYTWLHRSLYCIGDGIIQNPIDISRCINFFIKKLQLLLKNQITPIIIFDGDKLPMKNTEEDKRETRRNYFLKASEDLLKGEKNS